MKPLVVVRPEPGASATAQAARALGLNPVVVPLFAILPVEWTAPDAAEFDALLLTSANAVRQAGEQLRRLAELPAHCVGEATAGAARDASLAAATAGTSDVDALLASLPEDLRLLHLCGADRREAASPRQAITHVAVYRAAPVPTPPEVAQVKDAVVAIHSPRAAARLAELVEDRSTVAIAAISPAAAAAAGGGWLAVKTADQPTDSAVLALASALCNNA